MMASTAERASANFHRTTDSSRASYLAVGKSCSFRYSENARLSGDRVSRPAANSARKAAAAPTEAAGHGLDTVGRLDVRQDLDEFALDGLDIVERDQRLHEGSPVRKWMPQIADYQRPIERRTVKTKHSACGV